jgi:proteasome lid subunit RPN8/RPN11
MDCCGNNPVNDKLDNPPICPFRINEKLLGQMRSHVEQLAPEEACGLVAGTSINALAVLPMTNLLHSPVRYRIDPAEQLQAFNDIDQQGWQLLAIYHSHPHGPAYPSETDIREAYYPEAVYLIWSILDGQWQLGAFKIQDSSVTRLTLPT